MPQPVPESRSSAVRVRDLHSQVTRDAVLQAARQLFTAHGYAGTSARQLAQQAGVAVKTIYDLFGSKSGLLMAMIDLIDREADVLALAEQIWTSEDSRHQIALYAKLRRQIQERCGDIMHALRTGAAVEPAVAEVLAEGLRRRHIGLLRITHQLAEQKALKPGLSAVRAADIAAALVTDEVGDILVHQRGWSFDEYEAWLANTLMNQLLDG